MPELCDYNIIILSSISMNSREWHLALEHIFCMVVERFTFGIDFDKQPQQLAE